MKYPVTSHDSDKLFSYSLLSWWQTLRRIFWWIIIFVVIRSIYSYVPIHSYVFSFVIDWIIFLIAVYLLTASFIIADAAFRSSDLSLYHALGKAFKVLGWVYAACGIIIALIIAILFIAHVIVYSWLHLSYSYAAMAMILLAGIPIILVVMFFYLTIPLIAVYQQPLAQVFSQSLIYARSNIFFLVMIYIGFLIIFFASFTHTLHGQWLLGHHLMELTEFIIIAAFMPVMINMTLLLLNNERVINP
ncbi:MAG: hypothetical protein JSR33_01675 [Proteobacteria bacterium]|nr:hypothetical protein [Pseudomonadota bacterium]